MTTRNVSVQTGEDVYIQSLIDQVKYQQEHINDLEKSFSLSIVSIQLMQEKHSSLQDRINDQCLCSTGLKSDLRWLREDLEARDSIIDTIQATLANSKNDNVEKELTQDSFVKHYPKYQPEKITLVDDNQF